MTGEEALAAGQALLEPGERLDTWGAEDDGWYVLTCLDRVDDTAIAVDKATGQAEWIVTHDHQARLNQTHQVPLTAAAAAEEEE